MTSVVVNGVSYQIQNNKLNELIAWLEKNQATQVIDNNSVQNDGRSIING
jgi:hypothetical protein